MDFEEKMETIKHLVDMKCDVFSNLQIEEKKLDHQNMSDMPCQETSNSNKILTSIYRSMFEAKDRMSFLRRKLKKEIASARAFNRTEKVWTNRGLPIDSESLCSDAKKDAFDMKKLSESLPSTSVSGKETYWEIRQRIIERLREKRRKLHEHLEKARQFEIAQSQRNDDLKAIIDEQLAAAQLFAAKARPSPSDLGRTTYLEKCLAVFNNPDSGSSVSDQQKEHMSRINDMVQKLKFEALQTNRELNFGAEFAKMSLDKETEENRIERQNSDVDNKHQSVKVYDWPRLKVERNSKAEFLFPADPVPVSPTKRNALLPEMKSFCNSFDTIMGSDCGCKCGSCFSKRNWISNFRVPLNSPNKEDASTSTMNDSIHGTGSVKTGVWQAVTNSERAVGEVKDSESGELVWYNHILFNHDPISDHKWDVFQGYQEQKKETHKEDHSDLGA